MSKAIINEVKQLAVNTRINGRAFLVKACDVRKTKTGKDYLGFTLSDGVESINGNMWSVLDYVPVPGDVLDIWATVGEYQGNKQLTVDKYQLSEVDELEFLPHNPHIAPTDVTNMMLTINSIIEGIDHPALLDICMTVMHEMHQEFRVLPAAVSVHGAYVHGMLEHTFRVMINAISIADSYSTVPGCNINKDLVVAGAFLHDIGKLFAYGFNGSTIEFTEIGHLEDQIVAGLVYMSKLEARMNMHSTEFLLLRHIITSHHGHLEYGSPVTPKFIEAMIVHKADGIDAGISMMMDANDKAKADSDLTEKVYFMGNKPLVTQTRINTLLNGGKSNA